MRVLMGFASLVLGLLGLAGALFVVVFGPQLLLAAFVNQIFLLAVAVPLIVAVFAFRGSWRIAAHLRRSAPEPSPKGRGRDPRRDSGVGG